METTTIALAKLGGCGEKKIKQRERKKCKRRASDVGMQLGRIFKLETFDSHHNRRG